MGRYVWMCQTAGQVEVETGEAAGAMEGKDGKGCGHFEWAEFDDDGVPMWLSEQRRKEKEKENGSQEERTRSDGTQSMRLGQQAPGDG